MVLEAWRDVLGSHPDQRTTDFFDAGGDSLTAIRFVSLLRRRLGGHALALRGLIEEPSFESIVETLRSDRAAEGAGTTVVRMRRSRLTNRPVIMAHVLTGEVLFLRHVSSRQMRRPVLGLRSVGLEGGARPLETVGEMAARYLSDLRRGNVTPPYLLVGYSGAGLIIHEMARQLELRGEHGSTLMLVDVPHPAPGAATEPPSLVELKALRLLRLLCEALPPESRPGHAELRARAREMRPTEDTLRELARQLAASGLVPPDWTLQELEPELDVWARNVIACERYRIAPVTADAALVSALPSSWNEAGAEAPADVLENERRWRASVGRLDVRRVRCEHEALFGHSHTLRHLRETCDRADARLARAGER